MSSYYKAKVQYDGTGYYGFQWQKGLPSIQDDFNQALSKLVSGNFTTMGASRTDTGVHALEQYVKITSEVDIELKDILPRFNSVLPKQIRCLEFSHSDRAFRPTNDCLSKEYRYLFTNTIGDNHADRKFIANNPYALNLEAMKACVSALKGEHDFHNFVSMGSNVRTTRREIFSCELTEVDPRKLFSDSEVFFIPNDLEKCFQLRVVGNGFLKQMLRHLMTALWKVGNGRLTVEEFLLLLDGPRRTKTLWKVANPKGLFLWEIRYPER